jgi:hypothetical protein
VLLSGLPHPDVAGGHPDPVRAAAHLRGRVTRRAGPRRRGLRLQLQAAAPDADQRRRLIAG